MKEKAYSSVDWTPQPPLIENTVEFGVTASAFECPVHGRFSSPSTLDGNREIRALAAEHARCEAGSEPWQPHADLFLDALLPFREQLRGAVEAMVADGWSDEQARVLIVQALRGASGEQKT